MATVLLCGMLSWLSIYTLKQDQAVIDRRLQERLESMADRVVTALVANTASIGSKLTVAAGMPNENPLEILEMDGSSNSDYLVLVLESGQVNAYPRKNLRYYPKLPNYPVAPSDLFARGEAAEFQQKDYASAAAFYRNLATTTVDAGRAGALVRLGRTYRRLNDFNSAIQTYTELSQMGSFPINGVPAELLAHFALCTLYGELDKPDKVSGEIKFIRDGLSSARWQLNASSYRFYKQEIQVIGQSVNAPGSSAPTDLDEDRALILSAGAEELWRQWMRIQQGLSVPNGERCVTVEGTSLYTIWRGDSNHVVSIMFSPEYIEREWLNPVVESLLLPQDIRVAVVDPDGTSVYGDWNEKDSFQIVRSSLQSNLPWSMQLALMDPDAFINALQGRRQLFWSLLAIMLIIVLLAGYTIIRSVEKELEVARLQGDFVSAVSHEFRTPLASICHISELLAEDRVPSEEQRKDFYQAIQQEGGRLQHLVENILDFRKMEENAREYQMRWVEPSVFIKNIADDFASEVRHRGYQVEIAIEENLPRANVDDEALGRAIWNLLDNAVKYSNDTKEISIHASLENEWLVVSVKDHGYGIEKSEQDRVFRRFYRASAAKSAGIRGTGLGLAMVQRIVKDHGGYIELESSPGKGSTFSIHLPTERNT